MSVHRQADGDGDSPLRHNVGDEKYGSDADRLLRQLGESGYPGFLQAVVVAVDAGVGGGTGDGQGHGREQRGAPGLQQQIFCQEWGKLPDGSGQDQGHGQGDGQSRAEHVPALFRVCRYKAGDGSLDGTGAEGKADAEYGMYHIIDAQSLRADGAGQKNAVEKAQDPA